MLLYESYKLRVKRDERWSDVATIQVDVNESDGE